MFLCSKLVLAVWEANVLTFALGLYYFERIMKKCIQTTLELLLYRNLLNILYFDTNYLVSLYVMYHVCWLCFCVWRFKFISNFSYTVDSLYFKHPLSRTSLYIELMPRSLCVDCNLFFLSLTRTLSISNKLSGPLRVRDRESQLYY